MTRRPCRRTVAALLAILAIGAGIAGCKDDTDAAGGPDKERFCAKLTEFNTGTQAFDLNVADDAEVDQIAQLLDEIEASAPDEIRDDVTARFAYVDDVIAASRGDQDAEARLGEAEPTDEQQARIDAYAQRECGIVLDPAGTTPTVSPGATPPVTTVSPTTTPPTTAAA